jgi:hypothetical protein
MPAPWPLVGRRDALDQMAAALAAGDRAGVVLVGAAGVGKSRLATEGAAAAEASGLVTRRVSGSRAAATIPFGALAPLLPPVSDQADDRAQVLRWAGGAIAALGAERRLVLLVDDAHLLDEASATLLHQVAVAGDAFLVVTVRTGEPIPDPITALWKDGLAVRLDIDPLNEVDHDRLVDAALGGLVDAATRRQLFLASQGNPLLTRELVLAAAAAGALVQHSGVWRMTRLPASSPRLVELVEARLAGLDADQRDVLELIALGEPIGLRVLDGLGHGERVEALERRDLVRVAIDGRRLTVGSAHPLYSEVARSRLSPLRARAHRRALAEAVEATGARRREDALRVATWRLDAGLASSPAVMLEAARQARFLYDLPLSERLARAAVDAGAGVEAERLLGEVVSRLGHPEEAEAILNRAMDAATDDTTLAIVAMTRADNLYWGLGRAEDAIAVIDDVRGRITEELWRAALAIVGASHRFLRDGRPDDVLNSVGDLPNHEIPMLAVAAALIVSGCLVVTGRTDRAAALSQEAFTDHQAIGDIVQALHPRYHQALHALALLEAGTLAEAVAVAEDGYRRAVEEGADRPRGLLATMLGRARLLQGRVTDAVALLREAGPLFVLAGQPGLARLCTATLGQAYALADDPDAGTAALEELGDFRASRAFAGELERAVAWIALARGSRDEAVARLLAGADDSRERGEWLVESICLHDVARLGEGAAVAARLEELTGTIDGPLIRLRASHAAAVAAEDPAGLIAAADGFEAMGALLCAGEAAAAAAAAHERAGDAPAAAAAGRRAASLLAACPGAVLPALAPVPGA